MPNFKEQPEWLVSYDFLFYLRNTYMILLSINFESFSFAFV